MMAFGTYHKNLVLGPSWLPRFESLSADPALYSRNLACLSYVASVRQYLLFSLGVAGGWPATGLGDGCDAGEELREQLLLGVPRES